MLRLLRYLNIFRTSDPESKCILCRAGFGRLENVSYEYGGSGPDGIVVYQERCKREGCASRAAGISV